jgi:hypothetical protein
MAKFMVQVIHQDAPKTASYEALNAAMAKKGFGRELPGKKAMYHLPAGDYWFQGDTSASDLRVKVAAVAETIGLDCGIVVIRVDGWSVMRLKKVEAAPKA